MPALIETMKKGDDLATAWAAGAFGDIGPEAKDAVPELLKAVQRKGRAAC